MYTKKAWTDPRYTLSALENLTRKTESRPRRTYALMHVVSGIFTICPELSGGSNSKNAIFFSMFLIISLRIMQG